VPSNLELKATIPSIEKARGQARMLGAVRQGLLLQRDFYFRVRRGRLKLRECEGEAPELIYYERDESTDERRSIYRSEPVRNADAMRDMLGTSLGLLGIVEKKRELYRYREARIHIDDVIAIGCFLEFEVMMEDDDGAVNLMRELRSGFCIDAKSVIRCSYSDLVLAKRKSPEA
jgi:predicted adenylyl cyclase CyaB